MKTALFAVVIGAVLFMTSCGHTKKIMKNCEKAQSDFFICDEAN
jgi:hypothetical protein